MSTPEYYWPSNAVYEKHGIESYFSTSNYHPHNNIVKTCKVPECKYPQYVQSSWVNGDIDPVCHFCKQHMHTHVYLDAHIPNLSRDYFAGLNNTEIKDIVSSHTYVEGWRGSDYDTGVFRSPSGYKCIKVFGEKHCVTGKWIVHYAISPIVPRTGDDDSPRGVYARA